MTLNRTAIAVALALTATATASFADSYSGSLDLSTGSVHLGRDDAVASFEDIYSFVLAAPGYLVSSSASTASPDADHDLDFSSLVIKDSADAIFATFSGNGGNDANEIYWLPSTFMPAGAYSLVISGINSPGQASYSGNLSISVAAIPEPETYALMLAGLGLVGFMSKRRRPALRGL
jgi:hypothetical protein